MRSSNSAPKMHVMGGSKGNRIGSEPMDDKTEFASNVDDSSIKHDAKGKDPSRNGPMEYELTTNDNFQLTTMGALNDKDVEINDQSSDIMLVRSEANNSRKSKCLIIAVIFIILLLSGIAYVFFFWRFWEDNGSVKDTSANINDSEAKKIESCDGTSTLLAVPVTKEKFPSSTTECTLGAGESPFSIMIYRSEDLFYADTKDLRPLYADEIEQDASLKAKVLEYLTKQTLQRGITSTTKYGIVNGWVDSTQVVNNCGSLDQIGTITKVLGTKACFPIFEISYI